MSLRKLSQPDLRELRAIILGVIDAGDMNGLEWDLYADDEDLANSERLDFCNAIQQRIFATAVAAEPELPQRKGGTDA